jgi:hypothetical protein
VAILEAIILIPRESKIGQVTAVEEEIDGTIIIMRIRIIQVENHGAMSKKQVTLLQTLKRELQMLLEIIGTIREEMGMRMQIATGKAMSVQIQSCNLQIGTTITREMATTTITKAMAMVILLQTDFGKHPRDPTAELKNCEKHSCKHSQLTENVDRPMPLLTQMQQNQVKIHP